MACSDAENCGRQTCPLVIDLACELLEMYEKRQIYLKPNHFNSLGNNPYDGASSLSEVRDTCYARMAKRSAYGVAPGGCICLQSTMLRSMRDYAVDFWAKFTLKIEVNALAGSEHSANSWHYQGNVWDIGCSTPNQHCQELEDHCRSVGSYQWVRVHRALSFNRLYNPVEICYPGSSCGGHDTWVHCATPLD